MLYRLMIIILLGFLVFLNIVLFDIKEPLYYLVLFCSLVGAYSIIKGLVSNPR